MADHRRQNTEDRWQWIDYRGQKTVIGEQMGIQVRPRLSR